MPDLDDSATQSSLLTNLANKNDLVVWERVWEGFINLYGPKVARWCRRRGLDAASREEIVQRVYVKLHAALGQAPAEEKSSFRAWLHAVVGNAVRDAYQEKIRQARREQNRGEGAQRLLEELSAPVAGDNSVADPGEERQRQLVLLSRCVERVRERVEPHTWEVFWRRVVDGVPGPDVAVEFQLTENCVRQSSHRVMRLLRREYAQLRADQTTVPDPPPFPRVPGYPVREKLGQGGFGIVYKACDESCGRYVALKLIRDRNPPRPSHVERLRREITILTRLKPRCYDNIVKLYDHGELGGTPYLVLEYLGDKSLASRMGDGPLPAAQAASLVAAAAEGVACVHREGFVHQDIKPSNLLLARREVIKVADFGLAVSLSESPGRVEPSFAGTPRYAAPEQLLPGKPVSTAVDVFSLGVILYELLTGKPPFQGKTARDILSQAATATPPGPSALRRGLPPELDDLCMKCLAKRPEDRPPAENVRDVLRELLARR